MSTPFRERFDVHARSAIYAKTRTRHPEHIPAILERGCDTLPHVDREKFLLPSTLTGAQLQYVIRRRLRLNKEQALFLVCNGLIVPSDCTARELYARHHDPQDKLLYITYTAEHAFGGPTIAQTSM